MKERFIQFTSDITRIYKDVQKIKNQKMKEIGLKGTQLTCIFYLQDSEDGITLTKLASLCGEDKAAMSRTISELREQGYVTSNEEQLGKRYRARFFLTEEGRAIGDEVTKIVQKAFVTCGLTERERSCFYRTLKKLADNIDEYCRGENVE